MKKYIRAGMVGVLYTESFGLGWSTLAVDDGCSDEVQAQLAMDYELVDLVLRQIEQGERNTDLIMARAKTIYSGYLPTPDNLDVTWLAPDTVFLITEYDGRETVQPLYSQRTMKA